MGEANHSRTVVSVPRPPASKLVILKQAVWVWEDGARRPPSYYFLHYILIKTLTNIWRMGHNLSGAVGLRAPSSNNK